MSTVSVVIPSYNRAHGLLETVASVLAQTVQPLEVLVVDDGSTDGTPAVCARFSPPVRCIRKANGGVSSARNVGIAAARGEFIALLDADDLWPPEKLEIQLTALEAFPGAGWCISDHRTTNLEGTLLTGPQGFVRDFPAFRAKGLAPEAFFARTMRRSELQAAGRSHVVYVGDAYRLLFDGNFVFPSCAVLRREVAERAGPWDETFRVANDTEWFHRVAAVAQAAVVMTRLMTWRRGQENTLMQGRNVTPLVRNAITSLDRALSLRGDPTEAIRDVHAQGRRRLLLHLAHACLSVYDGRGARAALREARQWGAPPTLWTAAIWAASCLPASVLGALHASKKLARRGSHDWRSRA